MTKVTVQDLITEFNLELITKHANVQRLISTVNINRPGLVLAGYFDFYPNDRVQILGTTELSFIKQQLSQQEQVVRFDEICTPETPCIIVSHGLEVPNELISAAEIDGVPILRASCETSRLISRLTNFLEDKFAPSTSMHGVFVDISGVGVLITGNSGVGKSEAALELVQRGHRLVADDSVEIKRLDNDLVAEAPEILSSHLEIRGLGILNIMKLFGAGAVKKDHPISLVIELEVWEQGKYYDRIGLDSNSIDILGVEVEKIIIPIRPGRNIAMIIEVAAMNFNLRANGYNSAQEFTQKLDALIAQNSIE